MKVLSSKSQGSAQRVLITGISGFAGSHLADLLVENKYQVFGIVRKRINPNLANLEGKIKLIQADIFQEDEMKDLIKKIKPRVVFHLAAQSVPRLSFEAAWETFEANVRPQINILNSIVKTGLKPRVILIGSSEEYGLVTKDNLPSSEGTSLNPSSPYAVSKMAQDFLGYVYFKAYNLPIVRLRPFNHIGPRQDDSIATSSFASQIARIEKGKKPAKIMVGNLKARRDFTDVRDMVRAYFLAAQKAKAGEVYNIGSGKSYSLEEILKTLLSLAKIKVRVEVDPKLLRPADNPEMICDTEKFQKDTGWKRKYSIRETLKDILDYWRVRV